MVETAAYVEKPRLFLHLVIRRHARPVIVMVVQVELYFGQGGITANKIEQLEGTPVAAITYRPNKAE